MSPKYHLKRLLAPKSIAVIGGGAWCRSVVEKAQSFGFEGPVYAVHPYAKEIAGLRPFRHISDLPQAPDACFIGINRRNTPEALAQLAARGAGGAVCFASGFAEAATQDPQSVNFQKALLEAAGAMPFLGPNCYGFINALERSMLWPDQHGLKPVDTGVAILTQSSNIAINLTMQKRALPIAYMGTVGNQAQVTQAEMATALLDYPNITAVGLHIEGFVNLPAWYDFAEKAAIKGIPVVAIKVGRSSSARAATLSHTASLAGEDSGADALLKRLGIQRVNDLSVFLEILKIFHLGGPLSSPKIASISCSGGEASLVADIVEGRKLTFPPLSSRQTNELSATLGPLVSLANPLDYHTYIWRDAEKMGQAWRAMVSPENGLTFSILDYPREDRANPEDWTAATAAAIFAHKTTGGRFGVISSLAELLPEKTAEELITAGVIPLAGLETAIAAIEAAATMPAFDPHIQPLFPKDMRATQLLDEHTAKRRLAEFGVDLPKSIVFKKGAPASVLSDLPFPVVLKAVGLAHKTEAGGVITNLSDAQTAIAATAQIPTETCLAEEMILGSIAEILVGIVHDPVHGFILTLGTGGIFTEIWADTVQLLLPVSSAQIKAALFELKIGPILRGYRNAKPAPMKKLINAIEAIQAYAIAHHDCISEIEINPLIVTENKVVAVDALIREAKHE